MCVIALSCVVGVARAHHAWGPYHWARTTPEFTLKLGDSVSSNWDLYLQTASGDWNQSSVLNTVIVPGLNINRQKTCRAVAGRAEICNAKYGNNGWLGIASIWALGDHITQGTVKMNDTYFVTQTYNKPAWKNLVLCQEVGHLFGLDHQDENFSNTPLGTCMDYSNDPTLNQHPNAHDYEMLETIYAHLDGSTTVAQTPLQNPQVGASVSDDPQGWGKEIRRSRDGRASLYVREFAGGERMFTHVFWADENQGRGKGSTPHNR